MKEREVRAAATHCSRGRVCAHDTLTACQCVASSALACVGRSIHIRPTRPNGFGSFLLLVSGIVDGFDPLLMPHVVDAAQILRGILRG